MKLRKKFFLSFLIASVLPVVGAIYISTVLLDGLSQKSSEERIQSIEKSVALVVAEKKNGLSNTVKTLVSQRHPYVGGAFDGIRRHGALDENLFEGVGRYWLKGFDLDVLALLDAESVVLDAPFNSGLKRKKWPGLADGDFVYQRVTLKRNGTWTEVPVLLYALSTEKHGQEGTLVAGREISQHWFESIASDPYVDIVLQGEMFGKNIDVSPSETYSNVHVVSFSNLSGKEGQIVLKVQTGIQEVLKRIRTTGVWAGVFASFFALLISFWISKRLTKTLSELAAGAQRVAKGETGVLISVEGRDEVATLGHAFNQMTNNLESNQQKLVQAERVAAWQDIAKRLAHEIKNPLTPIKLSIETMKKSHRLNHPDFDEYFNEGTVTVLQEVDRLGDIVKEFSHFAKLPDLTIKVCDLFELVSSTVTRYGDKVDASIEGNTSDAFVMADVNAMVQIILNLIENAIGASTTPKTKLSINIGVEDDAVLLSVRDFGKGLSSESLKKCFTPYYTTKHAQGGSGLGLAIAHRLMTEQRGGIRAQNHNEGGAMFSLWLPKAASV